jgi:tetratricopeptide (TPR) repeat protein
MNVQEYVERGKNYYFKDSNNAAAIEDLSNAIILDPNYAEAYYYRSMVLEMVKMYKESLADIERALEIDPGNYYYGKQLKRARASAGYGFSIIGAIIGGILGFFAVGAVGRMGGAEFLALVGLIVGILIFGVRPIRRIVFAIFKGIGAILSFFFDDKK